MIEVTFEGVAKEALGDQPVATPLDGDHVWYEYCTQHDSRVRPSHAALDGTVWRADDPEAPTPPISYGCRCYLRYVAAPDTPTAKVLPVAPAPLTTVADAYAAHLDAIVPDWRVIAAEVAKLPVARRAEAAMELLKKAHPDIPAVDARDIAGMIRRAKVAHG